jgi:hypothetical protein
MLTIAARFIFIIALQDKIWSVNAKKLDREAHRFTAIGGDAGKKATIRLSNFEGADSMEQLLLPKDKSAGTRTVR